MSDEDTLKQRIALHLKSYRQERKLSLDAVAKLTGVSKAMLGQIEREESSPTIAKLWQISSGLGTSFSAFLSDNTNPEEHHSVNDALNDPNMQVMTINPYDISVGYEMLKVSLFRQHHQQSSPHSHGVIETVWILKGKLAIFADNQWTELEKNDVHRFHADQPHEYKALTDHVVFQNIITYPA